MNFNDCVIEEVYKNLNNLKIKTCCTRNILRGILINNKITEDTITIIFKNNNIKNMFFKYIYILFKKHKSQIVISNDDKIYIINNINELKSINYNDDCNCKDCKKYFLIGYILKNAIFYDPQKKYSCEISFKDENLLFLLKELLNEYGFSFKEFKRQRDFLLYTHESSVIEDVLTFISATNASLSIMDIKIYKQIRNNINRIINCETSNIAKTIKASSEQIAAIKYIVDNKGWEFISDDLIEIALLRFNNPEMTLSEMDQCLSQQIGRSALNNRLKKLCKMSEKIKEEIVYE